jgi:hypothetical protein
VQVWTGGRGVECGKLVEWLVIVGREIRSDCLESDGRAGNAFKLARSARSARGRGAGEARLYIYFVATNSFSSIP